MFGLARTRTTLGRAHSRQAAAADATAFRIGQVDRNGVYGVGQLYVAAGTTSRFCSADVGYAGSLTN